MSREKVENCMNFACPNPDCAQLDLSDLSRIVKNGRDRRGNQRYRCGRCKKTFINEVQPTQPVRNVHQKKSLLGRKSLKDQPELHTEVKRNMTVALTPTAQRQLDMQAEELALSMSELLERLLRLLTWVLKRTPKLIEYLCMREFDQIVAILNSAQTRQPTEPTQLSFSPFVDRYGLSARFHHTKYPQGSRDRYGLSLPAYAQEQAYRLRYDPYGLIALNRYEG